MIGHSGCCIAFFHEPESKITPIYGDGRFHYRVYDEKEKEFHSQVVELDGLTLGILSAEKISAVLHKKYYDEHARLQKIDGRKENEFKKGDLVKYRINPRSEDKLRVSSNLDTSGYYSLEALDTWSGGWYSSGRFPGHLLLRAAK